MANDKIVIFFNDIEAVSRTSFLCGVRISGALKGMFLNKKNNEYPSTELCNAVKKLSEAIDFRIDDGIAKFWFMNKTEAHNKVHLIAATVCHLNSLPNDVEVDIFVNDYKRSFNWVNDQLVEIEKAKPEPNSAEQPQFEEATADIGSIISAALNPSVASNVLFIQSRNGNTIGIKVSDQKGLEHWRKIYPYRLGSFWRSWLFRRVFKHWQKLRDQQFADLPSSNNYI